jgi:hypothetical protein
MRKKPTSGLQVNGANGRAVHERCRRRHGQNCGKVDQDAGWR